MQARLETQPRLLAGCSKMWASMLWELSWSTDQHGSQNDALVGAGGGELVVTSESIRD